MEIEIEQGKLRKALSTVSRVAGSGKGMMPILNNVLIKADKNQLILTTTNLELAIVENIGAEVKKPGVVTVPARLLADFVANLPKNEKISIKEKDNKITVSAGKYKSVINGMGAEDFPELPDINEKKAVIYRINSEEFLSAISKVLITVSHDMTRPILTGVYFNTFKDSLFIAATDGYRLADKELIKDVKSEVKAVVPAPALQEVQRSISDDIEEIEILFEESQVRFRLGEIEITSKIIDGSFPDYRQLIPKDTEINLKLDRINLERMVKVASLFAQNSGGSVVCEAKKEKGVFEVAAVASEIGENNSEVEVKDIEKDGKITLNSRFLIDVLNVIDDEEVEFNFSTKLTPAVIHGTKTADYTHIIMPLKN